MYPLKNQNGCLLSKRLDIRKLISGKESSDFPIVFSNKSVGCLIEALMEDFDPVVMQKNDFEYRDKAAKLSLSDHWDCQDFDAKNKLK